MMHRHTAYDKPRSYAGKRREPIYYSNLHPGPQDYPPVPDPKARGPNSWRKRHRQAMANATLVMTGEGQ